MKKSIKKAFTLVELLVVIAILAILATVSIVGYNSFTKKARVSNDTALVAQLNTVLKADSMVNGNAKTPTDALKITEDAGYDVEKLTPTAANYQIIWNQETNQFALLDESDNLVYGEKNASTYKNWKFVSAFVSTDYSLYLKGNSINADLTTLKAGVDVGNNTGINTIKYTGQSTAQNVIIRTNGGTLNVDNVNDTINHYGNVNGVEIISVGQYNEYGSVNKNSLNITTKGNVSIKDGTFVNSVNVPTTSNDSIKVDLSKNSVVRSIKGDTSFIKSNPNNIVFVTEADKTEVTQKISNCINDIGKIINKVTTGGDYTEEEYLDALKKVGATEEIDLYYTTNYIPTSAVSSLEIDGASYDFNETQRYSMGNNAILHCKVFKINDGKLCINKITFFSALSRKQVIKVNGIQISIKEDCYNVDTNNVLKMVAAPVFTHPTEGYVTPISSNEYNVYFYEGPSVGRIGFKVESVETDFTAIIFKKNDGIISYSSDKYDGDFGTHPIGYNNEKIEGKTSTLDATYFVFDENGEYLGSVNIILHCFVVAR